MTINNAEKSNKRRFLFIESWFENTSTELSQPCSNQIYVNMFAQNSKRTVAYLVLLSDGSLRVFVPGQCNEMRWDIRFLEQKTTYSIFYKMVVS